MRLAVLESVFRKYWLSWCLIVIECFVYHVVIMSPEYCICTSTYLVRCVLVFRCIYLYKREGDSYEIKENVCMAG